MGKFKRRLFDTREGSLVTLHHPYIWESKHYLMITRELSNLVLCLYNRDNFDKISWLNFFCLSLFSFKGFILGATQQEEAGSCSHCVLNSTRMERSTICWRCWHSSVNVSHMILNRILQTHRQCINKSKFHAQQQCWLAFCDSLTNHFRECWQQWAFKFYFLIFFYTQFYRHLFTL